MEQSRLWILMEFCGAGSVRDLLSETGALPEPAIVWILFCATQGLAYLHQIQIMHRDVKSAKYVH